MSAALLTAWRTTWEALVARGVHGPSAYWRHEAERSYTHPTARTAIWMVGRGGDKTRESVVFGITETFAGEHDIPPGERHYFAHVAENKDEAAKTLAIYEAYLRLLGVPFTRAGDTIELSELPRGVRVLACRVGAVSGFRCFGWTADECAKWDDDGADPSAEVIASIKAMTVTHPNARGRIISSPVTVLGYFYETWALGNTAEQIVGHAPSWVANDGITEAQTRALERDPRVWSREYAAVPAQAHDEALIDSALVDRSMRTEPGDVSPERRVAYSAAMDPSLGRNSYTFCIAGARTLADGRSVASIVLHRQWNAPRGEVLDLAAVLASIAAHCSAYRIETVRTDQFHGESLAQLAQKMNLPITIAVDKPTATERLKRYESLLVRFMDDAIEIPRDSTVRGDLLAIRRRVTKGSDAWTIHMAVDGAGRHADYAPAIALALERVVTEDAEPFWVRAMKNYMMGSVRPAPGPSRRPLQGPNPQYEPAALWFEPSMLGRNGTGFGEATPGPELERYDTGDCVEIHGAADRWPPSCIARCRPGQPTSYLLGAQGNAFFQEAVEKYRRDNGI